MISHQSLPAAVKGCAMRTQYSESVVQLHMPLGEWDLGYFNFQNQIGNNHDEKYHEIIYQHFRNRLTCVKINNLSCPDIESQNWAFCVNTGEKGELHAIFSSLNYRWHQIYALNHHCTNHNFLRLYFRKILWPDAV